MAPRSRDHWKPALETVSFPVLNLEFDLRSLPQHGRHRAILFLGQVHGVFHRLVSDIPTHAVSKTNAGIDLWERFGALGSGTHLQAGEGLALLAENTRSEEHTSE